MKLSEYHFRSHRSSILILGIFGVKAYGILPQFNSKIGTLYLDGPAVCVFYGIQQFSVCLADVVVQFMPNF